MHFIIFVAVLTTIASGIVVPPEYERAFAVFQIIPRSEEEVKMLSKLYGNSDQMLDFWKAPSSVNNSVDVMVYPEYKQNFTYWLQTVELPYRVLTNDLAALIEKYETTSRLDYQNKFFDKDRRLKDQADTRTRNDDAMRALNSLPMGEYYSYDQIVEWMQKLQHLNPSFVRQISIGTTHEGRNIVGLIIGKNMNNNARIVWIDAGIHAREWASIHTALYFIQQLISRYGQDPKITEYVNTLNIYIFPCLNPDGYEYTRSDPHKPAVRMWRKNRSPEKCVDKDSKTVCCKGVDLNRNFAFRFAEIGSSSSPCSEIYHGNYAFSEPESRAIRDAVLSLGNRIDAYITLHTYSQLWIYPYSHKKHAYSEDVNDLKSLARKAVASLQQLYGTHYRYGTGPEIIYPYAGGSCDWAKETAKIKYTYTLELRPSSFDWNGFILDKRQLIPTGRETFEGVKVVLDKVIENEKRRNGIEIPCSDVASACAYWISTNPSICHTNEMTMQIKCEKSCSFC